MANFSSFDQQSPSAKRQKYERYYLNARINLIWVVVFTLINILFLAINVDVYFLFSAFIPYFVVTTGMFLCGRFPEDYYEGYDVPFLDNTVFVVLLVVAVAFTFGYILAFKMSSKNRVGWLIFALAYFAIDTLTMLFLGGFSLESILDIVFHGWVIVSLILAIVNHYKLKKLPAEEEQTFDVNSLSVDDDSQTAEGEQSPEDGDEPTQSAPKQSEPLRVADKTVKHRVLIEKRMYSYDICYRRVKRTNELVINGNVYDEFEALIEPPHTLEAWIDGHHILVGYDGTRSYINVDGENVAKKLRIY